ncbi:MAG: TPM domain-containing protein [Flavobacteriales bacterium]|nr:TPM domain-containing protein [Flavobacteriales bacterium]
MKSNLILPTKLKAHILFALFVLTSGFGISQTYNPNDLKEPVFDSTGFVIDPDHGIVDEWRYSMHGSRKTYFFARYVEPVCVRVNDIKNPSDIDEFADELVDLWDLEDKTNGRFVFQLVVINKERIVYRFGSKMEEFYDDDFIDELTADIESIHFSGATGTGSFVSISKLGSHIFEQIAYDSEISSYANGAHIHSFYPDKVQKSNGTLTTMDDSPYQTGAANSRMNAENGESEREYFSGLSSREIQTNYARINTSGLISDIHDVVNQREVNNSRVTDPHFLLNDMAIATIDSILIETENETGYEVAVVCLNSIGDNDPHEWGTELFNLWGIGEARQDNGLLMLLVNDIHRIEFITGRGTEIVLTDGMCYDIQQEEMVPHFKNDDYVTGMIRGTQAVADVFYGNPPDYYVYDDYNSDDDYYDDEFDYEYEAVPFFEQPFVRGYLILSGFLTAVWMIFLVLSFFMKSLHKRYHTMKFFSLTLIPILFPVPFIILYFITKSLMERWRNTVRFSTNSGEQMHRLGESEEDKYLKKGQIAEEKVKSIDYDVWITTNGKEVLILAYKRWFTKNRKCPSCKYKTYYKEYNRTITSPTYTSSGMGEKKYKCENCGHSKVTRYTIPRLQRSSSSGGSSGGSYSSGGGSYSSGGSSYGGGSSGGGGAGSSW